MHLDNYSVTIKEGVETGGGYVKIQYGKQYTVRLNNRASRRCDAHVTIDGKEIGTFRLNRYGSITLERPPDSDGRFTFYKVGSIEADKADLGRVSKSDMGLVQVIFTPEKVEEYGVVVASAGPVGSLGEPQERRFTYDSGISKGAAGGTGLSGHSSQSFYNVGPLELDHSQAVTITLRLVGDEDIRPLNSVGRTTPVPPPVD